MDYEKINRDIEVIYEVLNRVGYDYSYYDERYEYLVLVALGYALRFGDDVLSDLLNVYERVYFKVYDGWLDYKDGFSRYDGPLIDKSAFTASWLVFDENNICKGIDMEVYVKNEDGFTQIVGKTVHEFGHVLLLSKAVFSDYRRGSVELSVGFEKITESGKRGTYLMEVLNELVTGDIMKLLASLDVEKIEKQVVRESLSKLRGRMPGYVELTGVFDLLNRNTVFQRLMNDCYLRDFEAMEVEFDAVTNGEVTIDKLRRLCDSLKGVSGESQLFYMLEITKVLDRFNELTNCHVDKKEILVL